ncbi:MAG: GspH/FimT family pseudopilin [Iphinoe sp. HA4291-MV1]|nr:GspH/FimT family pseudopilin [Iphinoe sp. HA4291-MV1]
MKKFLFHNRSSSGFTLLEILVSIVIISILAAIIAPSWLAFVDTQRLKTAQDEVYFAIRQAQSQATKNKLTWQVSFREQNGIVQWAVHPDAIKPADAIWNNLDTNVRLDAETTLQEANDGVRQIKFDDRGNIRKPPFGRVTLSSKYGGKTKRCVYISTFLGAMRTGKEHDEANGGKYCY